MVVVSVKGRDEGKLYIVTSIIDNYFVYVSDGKKKPYENPKRKNRIHLKVIDAGDSLKDTMGRTPNERIRTILECHYKEVRLPDVKE